MKVQLASTTKGENNYFLIYADDVLLGKYIDKVTSADGYRGQNLHEININGEVRKVRIEYYTNETLDFKEMKKLKRSAINLFLKVGFGFLRILECLIGSYERFSVSSEFLPLRTGIEIIGDFHENDAIELEAFYPNEYVPDGSETRYEEAEKMRGRDNICLKIFRITSCSIEKFDFRQFYNRTEDELKKIFREDFVEPFFPIITLSGISYVLLALLGVKLGLFLCGLLWTVYLLILYNSLDYKYREYKEILRRRKNNESEIILHSDPVGPTFFDKILSKLTGNM